MPRKQPKITLTVERVKKADADKIVRWLVSEFGAISILVAEEPGEPSAVTVPPSEPQPITKSK